MGIINWARSRFNGRTESKKFELERRQVVPEENHFTDEQQQWRSQQDRAAGFLFIGTLGNIIDEPNEGDHPALTHDLPEFTIEEAEKLQDALAKLLRRAKSKSGARGGEAEDGLGLAPLDRFLNCPSSLEVDRRVLREHDEGDGIDDDLSPNTKIILSMAKDLLVNTGNSRGSGIKNRSFKFLLRNMFVCGGGFAPSPSLKDPVESRMDKFLRTVLGKKINVRPSNTAAAKSYSLEDKPNGKWLRGNVYHHEVDDEEEDCCRWDRTDSEFIVLEI